MQDTSSKLTNVIVGSLKNSSSGKICARTRTSNATEINCRHKNVKSMIYRFLVTF